MSRVALRCADSPTVTDAADLFGDAGAGQIRRAFSAFHAAYREMDDEASRAGLRIDGGSTLSQMFSAALRHAEVWERRAKALERTVRDMLAGDDVPEDRRAAVLAVLHGRARPSRDHKLLSEAESAVVADLRTLAASDRQAVRRIIGQLAGRVQP